MTERIPKAEETTAGIWDDELRLYLQEIRNYPLLTAQQELEIAEKCAAGDENAIRTMVGSNLRLVISIARQYAGRGVPLPDLVQEGCIGLLIAARKFDCGKQCRFSTYATKWIRQGVSRCVLNHAGVIRVPRQTMERMKKILAVRAKLQQESGQEPTAAEIAALCGETPEKTQELMDLLPQTCSLDAPAGEEEDSPIRFFLEDMRTPQPQEAVVRQELANILHGLLLSLNDRQQQVLRLRFGMEDGVCHTFEEIGERLHISGERARQIERRALDKLQKDGAGQGLEDFLI